MALSVIFLEDDDDLRFVAAELLALLGIRCEAVASVEELQAVVRRDGHSYDLAILDINLGADRPSGIDAYQWLRQEGFRGRISFLTGHAQSHPLVERARHLGDALVHEKPITMEQLRRILELGQPG